MIELIGGLIFLVGVCFFIIVHDVRRIKKLEEENKNLECSLDTADSTIQYLEEDNEKLFSAVVKGSGLTLKKLNEIVDDLINESGSKQKYEEARSTYPAETYSIVRLFVCGKCGNIYQKAFAETLYPKDEQILKLIMGEEYIIPSDPNTVCMLICKECLESIKKENNV